MVKNIIDDLRLLAQKCIMVARNCSNDELSRNLQELAADLAVIALEMEEKFEH